MNNDILELFRWPPGTLLKTTAHSLYAEGIPGDRVRRGEVFMVLAINCKQSMVKLTFLHSSGVVGMIPWNHHERTSSDGCDWFEELS